MSASEPLHFATSPTWIDYSWAIFGSQFLLGPMKWTLPISLIAIAALFLLTEPVVTAIQYTTVWSLVTIVLVGGATVFSARRLVRAGPVLAPATYSLTREAFAVESQVGKTQTDWSFWKQALEIGGVIIIKSGYGSFHTIPTRQLSDETLRNLRTLLLEKLGGRVQLQQHKAQP